MLSFELVAFDADDTLWYNERLYVRAQARLKDLLAPYVAEDRMEATLYQTEMRNLEHFGYGIKAFALSMIETAIELTGGRISAREIQHIIQSAREMMAADVELIEHVAESLASLATDHPLMLITKGDLRDQESKLSRSGLTNYFRYVEVVSDKTTETYRSILERHAIPPAVFLMVGNSLRSDILPVLELGGYAAFIPQELTWVHETSGLPAADHPRFHQLQHIGQLPNLVRTLESRAA
jgi:putative hydrolase of the HAD superfamily